MKKRNLLLLVSATAFVLLTSFAGFYPGGSPAGKTGSPGDGSNCSSCHGTAATTTAGWITSNIPAAGYTPGQAYQITATNNMTGSGKYGFEVSPQNVAGTLLGTLTAGTGTKLVGTGKYVTQSAASNTLKTWTFTWTAPVAGTGNVTFYGAFARNYSGLTTLSTLAVTEQVSSLPAAAGVISGLTTVCRNSSTTYSVATISGATGYVWSVPAGATIASGQSTTSVSVNFGSSAVTGNVSVYGSNGSGNGTPSNSAVTVNAAPSQPGAITGLAAVCQGSSQVFSVTNVAGVTYTWSLPAGSAITAGQGTNTISATMGATSGNMNVVPSNTCGGGAEQIKAITIQLLPGIAGTVSGPDLIDQVYVTTSDYATTAASDAASYQWELSPAGAGSIYGAGLTATVTWNGAYLGTAQVRVKALNACGEGAWSVVKSTEVINTTGVIETGNKPGMRLYPSPCNGTFNVALNGMNEKSELRLLDLAGQVLYKAIISGKDTTKLEYTLAPGIYLVQVQEGSKILTQKLVVR